MPGYGRQVAPAFCRAAPERGCGTSPGRAHRARSRDAWQGEGERPCADMDRTGLTENRIAAPDAASKDGRLRRRRRRDVTRLARSASGGLRRAWKLACRCRPTPGCRTAALTRPRYRVRHHPNASSGRSALRVDVAGLEAVEFGKVRIEPVPRHGVLVIDHALRLEPRGIVERPRLDHDNLAG